MEILQFMTRRLEEIHRHDKLIFITSLDDLVNNRDKKKNKVLVASEAPVSRFIQGYPIAVCFQVNNYDKPILSYK